VFLIFPNFHRVCRHSESINALEAKSVTTTASSKEDGNGKKDEGELAFERGLAELNTLAKHDPDKARALAQATIERIREALEQGPGGCSLPQWYIRCGNSCVGLLHASLGE
jgi:hypothetical protein